METKVITQETYARILNKLWEIDKSPETERIVQQETIALKNYRSKDMSKRLENHLEPACTPISLLMAYIEVAKELMPTQIENLERTTIRLLSPSTRINIPIVRSLTKRMYLLTEPTAKKDTTRIFQPDKECTTRNVGNGNGSASLRDGREKIIEFVTQALVPYRAGIWGKPNPHAVEFLLRTRTITRRLIDNNNVEWLVQPELFLAALKESFPE